MLGLFMLASANEAGVKSRGRNKSMSIDFVKHYLIK